jgi:2-amino-4-hydroxy-6-hydroxymethyldihydropteridine diphosphokinase
VETNVYIALGSNQGERELNLLRAVAEIGKLPGGRVTALSEFYETVPVGMTEQPLFCNAVLRYSTPLTARDLLKQLQHIENDIFGRKRSIRWGPRIIDLDIILFGNDTITEDDLTIPHPRMAERRFVLQPQCDIAPDQIHPVLGKRVADLLAALHSSETVTKI